MKIGSRESQKEEQAPGRNSVGEMPGRALLAMKRLTFPIVIEADADGYFVSCPALQGCYSQGDTYEEALRNIKYAIQLHIEDRLANREMPG